MTDNELRKLAVCGALFPYFHTVEVFVGPESRAKWNPVIFETLAALEQDGAIAKLGDFHWCGTGQSKDMAWKFLGLPAEDQERGLAMLKTEGPGQ